MTDADGAECFRDLQLVVTVMRQALKQIAEGRGRFSLDQLEFANNVIEEAKECATNALDGSKATALEIDLRKLLRLKDMAAELLGEYSSNPLVSQGSSVAEEGMVRVPAAKFEKFVAAFEAAEDVQDDWGW